MSLRPTDEAPSKGRIRSIPIQFCLNLWKVGMWAYHPDSSHKYDKQMPRWHHFGGPSGQRGIQGSALARRRVKLPCGSSCAAMYPIKNDGRKVWVFVLLGNTVLQMFTIAITPLEVNSVQLFQFPCLAIFQPLPYSAAGLASRDLHSFLPLPLLSIYCTFMNEQQYSGSTD